MEDRPILVFFDANGWVENPSYPHKEWQQAVGNGDTELGYAPWVVMCHEREGLPYLVSDQDMEMGDVDAHARARFPREDWVAEVAALDTRLGYGPWLDRRVNQEKEESVPS